MNTTLDTDDGRDLRICRVCWEPKPFDRFRRRSRDNDQRVHQCRDCHNESERSRRERQRSGLRREQLKNHVRMLKNASGSHQVEKVCRLLVAGCGGPEELLKDFVVLYHEAMAWPDPKRGMDMHRMLYQLMNWCEAREIQRQAAERNVADAVRDASSGADERMDGIVVRVVEELVRREPELVVSAAQKMGWRVVAPA